MKTPFSGMDIGNPASPLLRVGITYWGVTSANGNAGGTTLVCADLDTQPTFVNGVARVKLLTGAAWGQDRLMTLHAAGGVITVDAGFTAPGGAASQVLAGTGFVIITGCGVAGGVSPTGVGVCQVTPKTIDLNQAAGTYDLYTGTTQDVIVESFVIRMSGGAIGGALTSISIQTDDTTPQILINSTEGAVGNLTDQAQLSWSPAGGILLIKVGKKISLTIAGGAAGVGRVCDVIATCRAVVAGGYLA